MGKTVNIYFGAPLFSESEVLYNKLVVGAIRERYRNDVFVYNPCENEAINDKSGYADSLAIVDGDNDYLDRSDILIAVLDGPVVDPGLASEIGYFYAKKKPIIGIYSDSRQGTFGNQEKIEALDRIAESQFSYINLYTVGMVKKRGPILRNYQDMIEKLEIFIDTAKF